MRRRLKHRRRIEYTTPDDEDDRDGAMEGCDDRGKSLEAADTTRAASLEVNTEHAAPRPNM
jgi:hypothetical protein